MNSGMPPATAALASRRAFGNVGAVEDASQDAWGIRWIEALRQDVRYALRTFRKSPAFTIIGVLTLAVGISSTTAMFTVVNGVLLRKLPVREQDRVVVMWIEDRSSHFTHWPFTYGAFTSLRENHGAFQSLAGIDHNGAWSMPAEVGDVVTTLCGGIVAGDSDWIRPNAPVASRWNDWPVVSRDFSEPCAKGLDVRDAGWEARAVSGRARRVGDQDRQTQTVCIRESGN